MTVSKNINNQKAELVRKMREKAGAAEGAGQTSDDTAQS